MDPFFMKPWAPVRSAYVSPQPKQRPTQPKPKVVSIPVHFVQSDGSSKKSATAAGPTEAERSAAAVRIQKAFRGFLVRKNVRIVRKVAAEVEEIARRIVAEEEVICRDAKERLKVGEMLMALLLRLDSVRGVREYRKKVIRRVIELQEAVDSITAAAGTQSGRALEAPEPVEMPHESKIDTAEVAETKETGDPDQAIETFQSADIKHKEDKKEQENSAVELMEELPNSSGITAILPADSMEEAAESKDVTEDPEDGDQRGHSMEEILKSTADQTEKEENIKSVSPINQETAAADYMKEASESPELIPPAIRPVKESSEEEAKGEEDQMQGMAVSSREGAALEDPGMKEVMERVAAESERLKGLVAELCERSAQQCCLMGGLLERVEQLECAVQRMERKKKKRHGNNASSLDKKYGQKQQ